MSIAVRERDRLDIFAEAHQLEAEIGFEALPVELQAGESAPDAVREGPGSGMG